MDAFNDDVIKMASSQVRNLRKEIFDISNITISIYNDANEYCVVGSQPRGQLSWPENTPTEAPGEKTAYQEYYQVTILKKRTKWENILS